MYQFCIRHIIAEKLVEATNDVVETTLPSIPVAHRWRFGDLQYFWTIIRWYHSSEALAPDKG